MHMHIIYENSVQGHFPQINELQYIKYPNIEHYLLKEFIAIGASIENWPTIELKK